MEGTFMNKLSTMIIALLVFASAASAQVKWEVDKAHSSVGFKVKHLVISTVNGKFNDYDVTFTSNSTKDFSGAAVEAVLKTASIDTDNSGRDAHLKSDDFLNAEMYPEIRFKSESFKKTGDNTYKVTGPLTIRDVTKPVELDVMFNGSADFRGATVASFSITGELNRFDYNVKWSRAMEAGGQVVGDKIKFAFEFEFGVKNDNMTKK